MKIVNKLNQEAKSLEKRAAKNAKAAIALKQYIKELEDEILVLNEEAIKLGKSAEKHYRAALMLKGE